MKSAALQRLILRMLKTFDDLGRDPMARIDARLWAAHYRRQLKRLGVNPSPARAVPGRRDANRAT
jgi:hypothetical protein